MVAAAAGVIWRLALPQHYRDLVDLVVGVMEGIRVRQDLTLQRIQVVAAAGGDTMGITTTEVMEPLVL